MVLYIVMGFVPVIAVSAVKRKEEVNAVVQPLFSWPYVTWFLVWLVFAVFRYVGSGIGGTDAPNYIRFFDVCLEPSYLGFEWGHHVDFLYATLNKIVRLCTDDYHAFFAVVYALIVFSYVLVVSELGLPKVSYAPLIFLVFIYIRGFSSMRSCVAAALVLISIVLLYKQKYLWSTVLALSSVFVHKMSILYVFCIPILWYFQKRKMGIRECLLLMGLMAVFGIVGQLILVTADIEFFESGSYSYYAGLSYGGSFFDNFWKIAFPQLLLFAVIIFVRAPIDKYILSLKGDLQGRAQTIYKVCLYDIATIPATYILGIWRGYEFLCLIRLLMWGIAIEAVSVGLSARQKTGVRMAFGVAFIAWLVFRQYNTFADTALMPYVFSLFVS